ncbi:MAG: WD40/YVTN/BNR-like repeat-containing protein, partial [Longimicrobiales bacterium]
FFRSADAGATWVRQSNYQPRDPQYYYELYPDPHHPGRIYTIDVQAQVTDDEGVTWRNAIPRGGVHVDHHAFAFDPLDPLHIIDGNDGGLYQTFDGGQTWQWFANLSIGQFYHVEVDDAEPFYNVYGGTQDNGSLMAPSRTLTRGIANHVWLSIGGGDGMQPRAEPGGARYVYVQSQNGSITRLDRWTGESEGIRPPNVEGEAELRYTWNAPLIISPHSATRLYFGAQTLMRSDDRGETWRAVSGDLTRNIDRDTMPVMGRVWPEDAVGRHLFTNTYSTITAIDESPLEEGLLIAGTDDGLVQISEDGGQSWRAVRLPDVPDLAVIVDVAASLHAASSLYAVAHNFQRGDFRPLVFRSTDRGRTWTPIASNIPDGHVTWSIAEDHVNPDLLFLGTEFALFFTPNGGGQWTRLSGGVPTIMFRHLEIQRRETDLVAGTFGRGIYILDDYAPLRALTPALLASEGSLLPVRDALAWTIRRGPADGGTFEAPNQPYGALLTYYVRGASEQPPTIRITSAAGEVVAHVEAPARVGLQRVAWDLRTQPPDTAAGGARAERAGGAGGAGGRGGRGGRGDDSGPPAPPGEYTAQLGRGAGTAFTPIGAPQRFRVRALPPVSPVS